MGWTDTQDKELLLVTISKLSLTVSGEVWEKVAQELGRGLTGSAVKQHYNAICKKATPGGASKTAKSSASSTPKSTKKKASIAGAASAKGSKKRGVAEVQNDDEDTVESQEGAAWSNANEAKKTKVELSDDEDGEEYAF